MKLKIEIVDGMSLMKSFRKNWKVMIYTMDEKSGELDLYLYN